MSSWEFKEEPQTRDLEQNSSASLNDARRAMMRGKASAGVGAEDAAALESARRRLAAFGAMPRPTRGVDRLQTLAPKSAATSGMEHVEEARRELARLQESMSRTGSTRGLGGEDEDEITRLNTRSTRGVDYVERARRELARIQGTGDVESSSRITMDLQAARARLNEMSRDLKTNGISSNEDVVERARRELSRLSTTGKVASSSSRRECLQQKAALSDLKDIDAAGGLAEHMVTRSDGKRYLQVQHPTGGIVHMPENLVSKMIEHATHGCSPDDELIKPCANCAKHF